MTHNLPLGFAEDGPKYQEGPFPKASDEHGRLVRALWARFPARSESDLAKKVAAQLKKQGTEVSSRSVRNWLGEATTPHWRYVVRILDLLSDDEVRKIISKRVRRK